MINAESATTFFPCLMYGTCASKHWLICDEAICFCKRVLHAHIAMHEAVLGVRSHTEGCVGHVCFWQKNDEPSVQGKHQ